MEERKYFVTVDNHTVAENMTIDIAMVLCQQMFLLYRYEHIVVAIEEMPKAITATEENWIKE